MANLTLRLFGVVLLAAASWAQTAPAAPQPPAPAPEPQQNQTSTDQDEAQAEVDAQKAQADAQKEARKAAAQARKDAAKARADARKEVEKHRVMVFREGGSGSYLGVVDPRDVTSDRVAALKLKDERGVEANGIDRDSPAGKAGLKEHDVIQSFNGQSIEGVEQLRRMLRETPAGRTVTLGIVRNGQPMNVSVTLVKRPEAFAMGDFNSFAMPKIPPMPPIDIDVPQISVLQYSTRNGVMVEDLTKQLGDFFGVKDGQGVLVRSVQRGSAAEAAGLRAGDVIVKAGNEKITCSSDWRRVLRDNKGGTLNVGVVRDKREQSVTMKLPEKQTSDNSFHFEMENLQKELNEVQPYIQEEFVREMAAHRGEFERLKLRMLKLQKDLQQDWQTQ